MNTVKSSAFASEITAEGAAHGGAWGANPKLFEQRVTQFFAAHAE